MGYNNNIQFSDNIEKVIKNASKIALRFGSQLVGTEHILYGIVAIPDCLASKVLRDVGVTENELFDLFEQSSSGISLFGNVELTPRTKDLFKQAQQIAMQFNHSFIGTEHLLLAMCGSRPSAS